MDLDAIPDYDEFTQRTPTMQDLSGSVLENPTAIFNLDFHRGRAEALGEVDISPFEEEDDLNYIRDIEALCAVQDEGIEGVICGRSIYEGTLDLTQAQIRADQLSEL